MANIYISWTPSDPETTISQVVQYKVHSDTLWINAATVSKFAHNYIITGVTLGSAYDIRILSNCTLGGTTISNVVELEPTNAFKWILDPSASYCEETFPPDETGIVVVDIYELPSGSEIYGKINTPGISENSLNAHTGANFAPPSLSGNPAQCFILASDYVTSGGSLRWRFEFNVAKLLTLYPSTEDFIFEIRGIIPGGTTTSGAYSLKGADAGTMTMIGSPGSYIPSTSGGTTIGIVSTSYTIPSGTLDGTYTGKPLVCTFTYNRTTKILTKS